MAGADRTRDLEVGRILTTAILVLAMLMAPQIGNLGGMYEFIQVLLSLFQGPTLALLVLGAFTRHVTPMAGLVTLVTGVCLSGALTALGMNMLYVAFVTFIYALVCLWAVSYFTQQLPATTLDRLVFRRDAR